MIGKCYVLKQPYFAIAPIVLPNPHVPQSSPLCNNMISTRSFVKGCCALLSPKPISSLPGWLQARYKHSLDTSRVPTLSENDLEEQFVSGSGPGGSNVNKNRNCVVLKHKPTGMIVKCHLSRLLQDNRKLAREMMIDKLDDQINGDMSLSSQKERLLQRKSIESFRKTRKLNDMKKKYNEFVSKLSTSSDEKEK